MQNQWDPIQSAAPIRDLHSRVIMDSIRRMVQALRESSRAAEKTHGLSSAQLFVLHKLVEEPSLSVNELASRTHTHQSSVSVVVTKLVDQGLAARHTAADDARKSLISLTARGRSIARRAPEATQERMIRAIGQFPAPQRAQLAELLRLLVAHAGLDRPGVAPAMFLEDESKPPRGKSSR